MVSSVGQYSDQHAAHSLVGSVVYGLGCVAMRTAVDKSVPNVARSIDHSSECSANCSVVDSRNRIVAYRGPVHTAEFSARFGLEFTEISSGVHTRDLNVDRKN